MAEWIENQDQIKRECVNVLKYQSPYKRKRIKRQVCRGN